MNVLPEKKSKKKKIIILILTGLIAGGLYMWIFPKVLNLVNQEYLSLKQMIFSFWIIPLFYVVYFGVRAVKIAEETNNKNKKDENEQQKNLFWVAPYQFIFNFSCALFGWIALCALYRMYSEGLFSTTGGGIFGTILLLIAIAGITGNLPEIILRTRFGK